MAECSYFGTCGGCSYQDLEYNEQLELKRTLVEDALREYVGADPRVCPGGRTHGFAPTTVPRNDKIIHPTIPSPKPYNYRHMIALSVKIRRVGAGLPRPYLGFIGHDRKTFLPIENCPISDERINRFLPAALQKLEELPPERKFNTSQVVLRVGTDGEVVTSLRPDRGKELVCNLMGKTFTFSMSSFFQNNFSILEAFVETIRRFLKPTSPSLQGERRGVPLWAPDNLKLARKGQARGPAPTIENLPPRNDVGGTLFDLYSGVGLIGILLANRYQSVIGIEEGYEAVKHAKENAAKNAVQNISFMEGKVEKIFPELISGVGAVCKPPLHVVIDPPRIGLKPEVIDCLMNLPIKRLVYVSCELNALKRDLNLLTEKFRIETVQPMDFFPQTKHIETLVLLKPRDKEF